MFQLQAEHRHAAGLIDLSFKAGLIDLPFKGRFTAALPHKQVLTSASKNPLLLKHLYNLCICFMYEHLIINPSG